MLVNLRVSGTSHFCMIKCTQNNVALAAQKEIDFCVYLSVTQQFRTNGTPNRKSNVRAKCHIQMKTNALLSHICENNQILQ